MSMFGDSNMDKQDIAETIMEYANDHEEMDLREVIENIMEAVSRGIDEVIGNRE